MLLKELQQQFANYLRLGESGAALKTAIKEDWLEPELRLNIYRNNFRISLLDTLKTNFPVTLELVDEAFFEPVALSFIEKHPPIEPSLFAYSASFPAFLKENEGLKNYPFVPEVTALEYLANKISHAPDADRQETSPNLGDLEKLILLPWRPLPYCGWMKTDHNVIAIWEAHKFHRERLEALVVEKGEYFFLLYRFEERLHYTSIGSSEFAFLEKLQQTASLEAAVEAALEKNKSFDLPAWLGLLWGRQLVSIGNSPEGLSAAAMDGPGAT